MSKSSTRRMGAGVAQFSAAVTMEGASAPLGELLERSVGDRRQPLRLPADFVPPASVLVFQPKVELISESTARALRSMLLARDAALVPAMPSLQGPATPSDTRSSISEADTSGGLPQPHVQDPQPPSPARDGPFTSGWRTAISRWQNAWKSRREALPEQLDRSTAASFVSPQIPSAASPDGIVTRDSSTSGNHKQSGGFPAMSAIETTKSDVNGNASSETESLFTETSSESDAEERALGKNALTPRSASTGDQERPGPGVAEDVAEAHAAERSMGSDSPPPLRIIETSDTSLSSEEVDNSASAGSQLPATEIIQQSTNTTTTTLNSQPAIMNPSESTNPPDAQWNAPAYAVQASVPSSASGHVLLSQEQLLPHAPLARALVRERPSTPNGPSASTGAPLKTGSSIPHAKDPSPAPSTESDFLPRSDDVIIDVAGQSSASVAAALGRADVGALRVLRAGGVESLLEIGQPTFLLPGKSTGVTAVGLRRNISTSSISSSDTVASPSLQNLHLTPKVGSSAGASQLVVCQAVSAVPINLKIPIATAEWGTLPEEARQAILRKTAYTPHSLATAGPPGKGLPQPSVDRPPPEKPMKPRASESDDDMAEANDSPSEASSRSRLSVPAEKKRKLDPLDGQSQSTDGQGRSPSPEIPTRRPTVRSSVAGSEGTRQNLKRPRNSSPEDGEVLSDAEAPRPLVASLSAPSTSAEKRDAEGRRRTRNAIPGAGQPSRTDIVTRPPVNSEAHLNDVIARIKPKISDPRLFKPEERLISKPSVPSTSFARKSVNNKPPKKPTEFKHLSPANVDAINHKSVLEPTTRIAHQPSAAVVSAYHAKKKGTALPALEEEADVPPVTPVIPVAKSTSTAISATVHPTSPPSAPAVPISSKVSFENGCGSTEVDASLERIALEVANTHLRHNIGLEATLQQPSLPSRPSLQTPARDVNSGPSLADGQGRPERRPEQYSKGPATGVRSTPAAVLTESLPPRGALLAAKQTVSGTVANGLSEKATLDPLAGASYSIRVGPVDRAAGFQPGLRTTPSLKEMEGRAQRPAPWSSQFGESSPTAAPWSPHPSDPRLAGKQGTFFSGAGSTVPAQAVVAAPPAAEGRPVSKHVAAEGFALSDLEFHNRILDHLLSRGITRTEDSRWEMSDWPVQSPRTQAQEKPLSAYYDIGVVNMARRLIDETRDVLNKINNHTIKSKPQEEGNVEREMRLVEDNRHSPEKQNGCARLPRIRLEGSAEAVRCFKVYELLIVEALFQAADTPRPKLCLGYCVKATGTEMHLLLSGQSEALHAKQKVKILKKLWSLKLQQYQAKALYRLCKSDRIESPFRQAVVSLDRACFATEPCDGALLSSVGSFYPRLNARQREIVCNMVQSVRDERPRMLMVQGQPWTGKHHVMTAALRFILRDQSQILLKKKILIVLPTEESAARAVRHLWTLWKLMTNETLVLAYLESRKHLEKRIPPVQTDDVAQFLVHHNAALAVSSRRKELEEHVNQFRLEMAQHLPESEEYRSAEKSLQTFESKLKESKTPQQERAIHETAVKNSVAQCQVLVTSVMQCASSEFQNLVAELPFACIVLPEAGRSSEVDTVVALTAAVAVNKAILLGCVFDIPVSAEEGREMKRPDMDSFLHRAWVSQGGVGPRKEASLFQSLYFQYVNDPEISAFIARAFYRDRLIDKQVDKRPEGWPFVPVKMLALPNEASLDESCLIAELVKELLKQPLPPGSITVVTRTTKQAYLTQERLKLAINSEATVRVCAAAHFQGYRSHMVIFSSAGDACAAKWEDMERRRMFVAISAAAHSLLVVGKTATIRESAVWLHLEQHLKERRMYISVPSALAQAEPPQREAQLADLVRQYVLRPRQ